MAREGEVSLPNATTPQWPEAMEWPQLGVPRRVTTGCQAIDEVLGGGFKIGEVTEICGESALGKTQLCMQSIIADRLKLIQLGIPSKSIYITARCGFAANRFHEMCKRYYDEGGIRNAMQDVDVVGADTQDDFMNLLNQIKAVLEIQETLPKKTRVIVIDSIFALFSYASRSLDELEEHRNIVSSTGFGLKRLAHKFNLAILVCNRVVNTHDQTYVHNFYSSGRLVKPAVWKPWEKNLTARVILAWEIDATGTEWRRTITQVKGDAANSGKCEYYIDENGLTVNMAQN